MKLPVIVAILLLSMIVPGRAQQQQQSSDDHQKVWGPRYSAQSNTAVPATVLVQSVNDPMVMLHHWNHVAIDASGLDHTPVAPGENRVFGEQVGPCRAARAEAIVHIAIFEAVNSVAGGYQSYVGIGRAPSGTSMSAAIAKAAHDTLCALFPSQTPSMDAQLATDLSQIANGPGKTTGIKVGQKAAAAILAIGFLYAGHQHFAALRLGYETEKLRNTLTDAKEEQRRLAVQKEVVASPARLEQAARQLGMQPMQAAQLDPLRRPAETRATKSPEEKKPASKAPPIQKSQPPRVDNRGR